MKRAVVALLLAVAACFPAARSRAECKLLRLAELPVTMVEMRPLVAAKINGADARFLVDSGAFYSNITPGAAAEFGLHLAAVPSGFYVRGVGGDVSVSLATVKKFTLADSTLPNIQFLVGGSEVGADSAGLLGQNLLRLADVEYDLANGVIRLLRPEGCDSSLTAYWVTTGTYSEMDLAETSARKPWTRGTATVNGVNISVIFDTGAETSFLSRAAAKRAGIDVDGPGVVPAGMTGGLGRRWVKSWIAPVADFKVGDEEIRHTKLRVGDTVLDDVDMLIGADFFLSHRIYVANGRHKLYFTYNGGPVFNLDPSAAPKPSTVATPGQSAAAADVSAPTDAEGFSRRGAAFLGRREYEKALADLTRACELAPGESRYFYQRALAHFGLRQASLALADLDQALKLQPDDVPALVARAEVRLGAKDKTHALLDLDAASTASPKEADTRLTLGELYLRADAYEPAIAEFDMWIKAHPVDNRQTMALNGVCWASGLWGQKLGDALAACDKAVRSAPKNADVLDSRGLVRLRLGNFNQAIADYDAAIAIRPNSAWSLYGRGIARLKAGLAADGGADIAAARALDPTLPAEAKRRGIGL